MNETKAIVRATGTVTYDTAATAGNDPASAPAPADATQFERLKDLFDELGVKYEVLTNGSRSPFEFDFVVKPGEKWLKTDGGEGYSSYYAAFGFTADGQFLRYGVAE
jgi:hypothetical protein